MTKRYRMEYVNDEVSAIHDDYEKEEMCAEVIVDRLNQQEKTIKRLKEIIMHSYEHIICDNCMYCKQETYITRYGPEYTYKCLEGHDCSKMVYVHECEDFDVDIECTRHFDKDFLEKLRNGEI